MMEIDDIAQKTNQNMFIVSNIYSAYWTQPTLKVYNLLI